MNKVRTRFAPSPTGSLHIGGLRTALYAFALAKRAGGDFILRIEDTDKKREVAGSREKMEELLKLFGLTWDEHYVQSQRVKEGIYKKAAKKLEKAGHAYSDGGAIRLKVPKNEKIGFHDFVLDKDIEWDTNTLEDLVLLKSDGFPTYHLAVVVDDNDMKISHVLRGHDWLPSTPIHLLVYKYLGFSVPEIGHLTDILDPEGGKLSKRKGSSTCEALLADGYLPEAILNFVMLLGWAPKNNQEIFSLDEFVDVFDTNGLQKANPVFNKEKLRWFNDQWLMRISTDLFVTRASGASLYREEPRFTEIARGTAPIVAPRIGTFNEYDNFIGPFYETPKYPAVLLGDNIKEHLREANKAINKIEKKDWNAQKIGEVLEEVVRQNNFNTGAFFMDLRIALTGKKVTLPVNDLIFWLKKKESLKRLKGPIT